MGVPKPTVSDEFAESCAFWVTAQRVANTDVKRWTQSTGNEYLFPQHGGSTSRASFFQGRVKFSR